VLKEQADRSLVRLERDGSLRVQIERIMAEHGPLPLTMENAARELGMSARSLQRRLLAEKLNFAELVTRHRVVVPVPRRPRSVRPRGLGALLRSGRGRDVQDFTATCPGCMAAAVSDAIATGEVLTISLAGSILCTTFVNIGQA
jgi:hypothetical protein